MPGCNGTGTAKRSYPMSKVRGSGQEEPPLFRGQGGWPRGAILRPRPGAAAGRSHTMSKEWWLRGHRRAWRSYPTLKVRKGGCEEILSFKVRSSGCALLEQL